MIPTYRREWGGLNCFRPGRVANIRYEKNGILYFLSYYYIAENLTVRSISSLETLNCDSEHITPLVRFCSLNLHVLFLLGTYV